METFDQAIEFVIWLAMYLPAMMAEWARACPYLADMDPGTLENVFLGAEGLVCVLALLACHMCYRCCRKCGTDPVPKENDA